MTTFAPVTNFAYALLDGGITAAATSFSVVSGGSKFPLPSMDGNFNASIWNVTDYEFAHLDPNAEIVTVTGRSTNAFTVTRGAESTSAVAHNTTGKTYAIALTFSKSSYDAITSAINERGVLLGGNTWTGINAFDEVTANKVRAVGSGGLLIEANNGTDVALFGAGGSSGATFYGGVNVAGSISFTGSGVTVLAPNTIDGGDLYAITLCGGGGYGPTRGSGVAVIGNEYASIGGDLELMAGDSAISGAIKFYVGNGAGSALLAGSIARSTMLTTFNGSVVANSTLSVASTLTVGGQATFSGTLTITATKQLVSSASIYNYVDISNASGNLVASSRGSIFLDIDADNNSTSNVLYVRFNSATYTGIFEEDGALTLGPTLKNGSGALYCGGIAVMNNGNVTITNTNESTTLTNFTQSITNGGFIINTEYTANAYTPGLFWATSNDNATKPKAGVFMKLTGSGTYLILGTSTAYATGINGYVNVTPAGGIETTSKIQIGSTTPTASAGSAITINSSVTTGSAGSGSLIIQGANNTERIKIYSAGGAGGGGPLINLFSSRGSIASPTATQGGDIIGGLSGGGYGATGYSGNCYGILQCANENWTDSAQGTYTLMQTTGNGTTSPTARLLINHDGAVTLGSSFSTGTGALYAGSGTFTGLLTTVASASGSAGFRLPHGTAPSSPVNGDIWTSTSGMFVRINGVTKTVTLT